MTAKKTKPIIYQLLPRLFTNYNERCIQNGTLKQNCSGKLNDITDEVLSAIKNLGTTHVWYTGVIEHAHDVDYTRFGIERDNPHVVKGKAGSPYAISDYYDIDPDVAVSVPDRIKEFESLVDRTHNAGMKVIIDFVPNHVARRYHSDVNVPLAEDFGVHDNSDMFFERNNNFYYITRQQFEPSIDLGEGSDRYIEFPAKASGNDCFTAFPGVNDWYETVKLNYGIDYGDGTRHFDPIPDTWFKMLHILRYWASKGVDGFRCDMAHMVPVEFWEWAIANVRRDYPEITFIAELYDTNIYGEYIRRGGFDYLYDKVNLYDMLRAIECYNTSAARITDCWQRVDGLGAHMLNFLENHDEQRYASPQYAGTAETVLPSLVVSSMINTGPMMIYFGQELGEPAMEAEGFSGRDGRTTIFDYWSVSTVRRWLNKGNPGTHNLTPSETALQALYRRVLQLCNSEKAIRQGAFYDLMYVNYNNPHFNPHRQYAFLRYEGSDLLLIAVNFDDNETELHINIPAHALSIAGAPEGEYNTVELLTNKKSVKNVSSQQPFVTSIDAHGAVIYKLKQKKGHPTSKKQAAAKQEKE